jgi:hypothetical protein
LNKFVIGGGWSVAQQVMRGLTKYGDVIGVNDSALWWPDVNICVTMDRLWFEHRWPLLKKKGVKVFVREKCDCNVKRVDETDDWRTFVHWNNPGLTMEAGTLFGANSGICAINLAYKHMNEGDRLFLLGFDMQKGPKGECYWYPPYPWAPHPVAQSKPGYYLNWAKEFGRIAECLSLRKIETFSVNPRTILTQFPVISSKQMQVMLDA